MKTTAKIGARARVREFGIYSFEFIPLKASAKERATSPLSLDYNCTKLTINTHWSDYS